ncbi:MAG: ribosomal RNA small subunit methyltransferase A, partial [Candidatus Acidiferrales bacterium]
EVAVRMTAKPGRRDYGYLSAVTQFYTQPEIALRLPPGAFQPRPKVASALVRMTLPGERAHLDMARELAQNNISSPEPTGATVPAPAVARVLAPEDNERAFLEFVGYCFEQKRKTIANNLRARFPAPQVEAALAATAIKRQARAEELRLRDFATLFRAINTTADERR